MEYNEEQKQAIRHKEGPCLVLAGPGSGKTAVITRRTRYLIEEAGVEPNHILVVTFTRAAAGQMRRRFEKLTDKKYPGVTFGTFHSVFFAILKHAYHYTAANIAREEDKYNFLREIFARNHIESEDQAEFSGQVLGEISSLKNTGVSLDHYYPIHCGKEVFACIYREYERMMQSARLLDFDDILVYTKELLEAREDYRRAWQEKFSYIMVDEFQDINPLQYQIVRLLAGDKANLFAVGDDDQSIYRFRGSNPDLMLSFPKDYPKTDQISLAVNYRCPQEVIDLAARGIAHNQNRFAKQIRGCGKKKKSVYIRQFADKREEDRTILDLIREKQRQGLSLDEIAVLYRTNTQPGALIARLMEYNLPFQMKEQVPSIYEHWIAKDLKAYFQLALGLGDRVQLLRIMNRPNRYLSRDSLSGRNVDFSGWREYYKEQYWIAERIEKLEYDLKILSRIQPFGALNYIRQGIGYDDFLKEYADRRQIPLEDLMEIIEELQESMRAYKKLEDWLDFTDRYTKELKEQGAKKKLADTGPALSILTLHGAKGLEYDLVIIPDLNEGLLPYKKAVLEAEIEEERRLFYVGMTRTKKELHLYHTKVQRNKDAEPSRFLKEIL